jgi:hypothetical protein
MWLIFVAFPALSAVQYDFTQHTQSDIDQVRPSNLTGRALIDGERSRIDFLTGDLYPPGTYCLGNGARSLTFVDPVMKSYTEFNSAAMTAAMGSGNINISNLKSESVKLEDHPTIAGLPTDHYRLSITFDMAVNIRSLSLHQAVHTEIDKWTSMEFGDVTESFLGGSTLRTGNPQLDEIIDLDTNKSKGFPLKQTMKITTRNLQGSLPNSKLGLSEVRTQSRELMVTSIRRVTADPNDFTLPASYRRNSTEALAEKQGRTQFTVLSFEEGKSQ